jgi:hypothetical protein
MKARSSAAASSYWIAAGIADIAQTGAALEFAAAHADESSRTLWRLKVGLR